ncbi:DUF3068 domain-containing protein [Actinokineospora sp. HUAS TT18]|uniref:DUF3068 domain-containing protein n=1 Tax=Actinokineospora sp. HUAS TT18 TaxID=3447451 RepID=UPI003F523654
MRRVITFVLLGLGVFAVATGLLLQLYAYPRLAKVPHNIDTKSVAQGSGITALVYVPSGSSAKPEIRENISLTSTTHVTGDLSQPEVAKDSEVTAWTESTIVKDDSDELVVTAGLRGLCMNRHTGEAVVPCEGQFYEDEKGDRKRASRNQLLQPGLNFKFPFGAEQKTYKWFDTEIKQAVDARFTGEEQIKGVDVNKYVITIPPTKLTTREVPGSLIGKPDVPTVKADLYYEVTRTLWVEPTTGAVLAGRQDGKQELRESGQAAGEGTYVFNGTLQLNDETVSKNVEEAKKNISKLWAITTLPTILWISGAVITVAAIVLLVMGGGAPQPAKRTGNPPTRRQGVGAGV